MRARILSPDPAIWPDYKYKKKPSQKHSRYACQKKLAPVFRRKRRITKSSAKGAIRTIGGFLYQLFTDGSLRKVKAK